MNFWENFRDQFLTGESYEYLGEASVLSIPWMIIAAFVGIAIAFIVTVFTKRVLGEMVRKLLAENALSAESAKTMSELSLEHKLFLRRAVKGNVSLRRVVRCSEEEEFLREQEKKIAEYEEARGQDPSWKKKKKMKEVPFRVDPDKHHFYIPEECRDMASVKFDKKGTSIGKLLILLALLLIFLIVILLFLPRLMELVNDFVGTMKSAASSGSDKIVS